MPEHDSSCCPWSTPGSHFIHVGDIANKILVITHGPQTNDGNIFFDIRAPSDKWF